MLEYLILLSPLITHVLIDLRGTVKHGLNAVVMVLIAAAGATLLMPLGKEWLEGFIYTLAIHGTFFDPIYNLTHDHPIGYNGDKDEQDIDGRAWWDKIWDYIPFPHGWVVVRLIILGIGVVTYYGKDLIHY